MDARHRRSAVACFAWHVHGRPANVVDYAPCLAWHSWQHVGDASFAKRHAQSEQPLGHGPSACLVAGAAHGWLQHYTRVAYPIFHLFPATGQVCAARACLTARARHAAA